ncbi:MAG TPA: hypothetical protein DCD96_05525 [Flavobacteriales bacterium]|nr:hypothetical protein [Flavobacteriales bacterium]HRE75449.1 hypothetical protein [Flavobacteriales bacterium]HRJ36682.1 hypothetical protein [Flavobacteriales bacterium]HRJ37391.1 hypothetical protein [Flavobacteriales bacterium]
MKRSTITSIVILLIMIYPFYLGYLAEEKSDMAGLIGFLITVFGFLIIMTITAFGGESRESH